MPDFAVSTAFTAQDKITKTFRDMDKGAARFGRTATKSFRNASASASRFRDITKGILAAGVVQRGIGLLTRGLGSLTEQFLDFDQATIGAAARFKDIGPDAVNFEGQLKLIRDRAREAGAATEFTAAQSAEALNFLAKAGFTSAEAMGSLSSMINLATATGEDFATVADFSSDLLGSFGLNVDDTAQKIKNLARLNDVLVKASNTANVTVEDLFETMKIAAPIAVGLGQSLEDVTAVTAFLGGTGIKGSQAATALKNSFLNLASPSSTAAKMLKALGVQVDDGTGNMRGLNDIIGDLAPELDKMGNIKAAKVLDEIFGKRAIAGAINIGKGTQAIKDFKESLLDAGGAAQATADRLRKSMGNRLLSLASATAELGFKFIEAFEVRGENAIFKLTEAVRNFDPKPIIEGIETAVLIFKTFWAILKPFVPLMPWLIGMWIAFAAVTKLFAIAQMITSFAALTATLIASGGAMAALNAIMIANPIGAIIIGVTALVALLVLVVRNWDAISAAFSSFMGNWVSGIAIMTNGLSGILKDLIIPISSGIRSAFEFLGLADEREAGPERVAPNREEAAARSNIGFKGQINIAGAPKGTTVESETTGAPDIDMALLGGA